MIRSYLKQIIISGFLLLSGWLLSLLMVINVLEKSLWLSFLSFGLAITGLFIGMLVAFSIIKIARSQHEQEENKSYNFSGGSNPGTDK